MEATGWLSMEGCDPTHEALPGFDLEALRGACADPSTRIIQVRHRACLLDHPQARELNAIEPSFAFVHQGPAEGISARLKSALRAAGLSSNRAWEALDAEISYLVRVFASLAEDPAPAVFLAAPGAPAPSPSPTSRLALVCDLVPGGSRESDTALIVRGRPCVPG